MAKKKITVRHRNKLGQFSKRGKRERVYSHAKTILRRIAKEKRARKRKEKQREITSPPPSRNPQDFLVVFSRTGYDDVSFTVIAFDDKQAIDFIRDEILNTDNGKKLLKNFRPAAMSFDPPRYRTISDLGFVGEREQ